MTNGKCDYTGCHKFGEQRVSWRLKWDDTEYCEDHALPEIDRDWYTIERPAINAEG